MHLPEIERNPRSRLERVSSRVKLGCAFAIIVGTALLPRRWTLLYLIPFGVLLPLWALSRMPLRYMVRRLLVLECFVGGLVVLSVLTPSAAPVVFAAVLKSNLCLFAMLLLTWTTPFLDILQELRRLRFPPVMLSTLALMYRYLPVLGEETRRMLRARASRTFSPRRVAVWHNLALIIGQLFIRS